MTDEARITKLAAAIHSLSEFSGGQEDTKIVPNAVVIDAAPVALPAGYIIIEDEQGYYVPAVTVAGLSPSNGDFVNLLNIKGTESIAFQYGTAGSVVAGGAWPPPNKVRVGSTEYDTITAAEAAASAGDLLKVGEGTWNESFTISKSLSIIGADRQSTKISQSTALTTIAITANPVYLEGLEIINTMSSASKVVGINITDNDGIVINNCEIDVRNNGAGDASAVELDATTSGVDVWLQQCLLRCSTSVGGSDAFGVESAVDTNGVSIFLDQGAISASDFAVVLPSANTDVYISLTQFWLGQISNTGGGVYGEYQDANYDFVLGENSFVDLDGIADALVLDADGDTTISAPTDDQIDFEVGGADVATLIPGGFSAETFAFIAKNTAGVTTVLGDVGYLDEAGEYKETTNANDNVAWCTVLTGGANNADIYVARRGRVVITLNANCSIGDFLVTSTTAGQAGVSTVMRPEIFAVALTANVGGAGGTCEALLLTETTFYAITSSNLMFHINAADDSDFRTTINGAPAGAVVTYTTPLTSGNENTIKPTSGTIHMKIRLYNETRSDYALIDTVDTGANTITLTAAAPGGWANTDVITTRSQTCVEPAPPPYYYDIDLSDSDNTVIPLLARAIMVDQVLRDTGGTNQYFRVHPFETFDSNKFKQVSTYTANIFSRKASVIPLIEQRACVKWIASGAATAAVLMPIQGYFLATP